MKTKAILTSLLCVLSTATTAQICKVHPPVAYHVTEQGDSIGLHALTSSIDNTTQLYKGKTDDGYYLFSADMSMIMGSPFAYFNENRVVTKEGRIGFLNDDGGFLFEPIYEYLFTSEKRIYAKRDGLWGIFTITGDTICPHIYKDCIQMAPRRFIMTNTKDKAGIIDYNNKVLIPFEYDEIEQYSGSSGYNVRKNGKAGFISFDGKRVVIPFEYDLISAWWEYGPDAYYVKKDGKVGYLSLDGSKQLVPLMYEEIFYIADFLKSTDGEFLIVLQNGKYGVLSFNSNDTVSNNQTVIPIEYEVIYSDVYDPFLRTRTDDDFVFYALKDGIWHKIDKSGKTLESNIELPKDNFSNDNSFMMYINH